MTREEFAAVDSWYELREICEEYGFTVLDDIVSEDDLNYYIQEEAHEYLSNNGWESLRDALNGIPTDYEMYIIYSFTDIEGVDNDEFDDFKRAIEEELEEYEAFEDENESETDGSEEDSDETIRFSEPPISFSELLASVDDEVKTQPTNESVDIYNLLCVKV